MSNIYYLTNIWTPSIQIHHIVYKRAVCLSDGTASHVTERREPLQGHGLAPPLLYLHYYYVIGKTVPFITRN